LEEKDSADGLRLTGEGRDKDKDEDEDEEGWG
jgi:hypothetical protein